MLHKILNIAFLKELGQDKITIKEGIDNTYCPTYYELTNDGIILDTSIINVFQYSVEDGKTNYDNTQLVCEEDIEILDKLSSWIDVTYNVTSTSTPFTISTEQHIPIALDINGERIEGFSSTTYTFESTGTYTVRSYYDTNKTDFTEGIIGTPLSATKIDTSNLKTPNATNFKGLFANCTQITSIDGLSALITDNVTSFEVLFYNCSKLNNLSGVENWDTSSVTTLKSIFALCSNLTHATAIENWNTSNVETWDGLFAVCSKLQSFSFENLNTSSAKSLDILFYQCYSLKNVEGLQNFEGCQLNNVTGIFNNSTSNQSSITKIEGMENWDVSNINYFAFIYKSDQGISIDENHCHVLNLSGWTPSSTSENGYESAAMFYGISPLEVYLNNFINENYKGTKNFESVDSCNVTSRNNQPILIHADNWKFKTDKDGNLDMNGKFYVDGNISVTSYRKNANLTKELVYFHHEDSKKANILLIDPVAIENVKYLNEVSYDTTRVTITYDGVYYQNEYHLANGYTEINTISTEIEGKRKSGLSTTVTMKENTSSSAKTYTGTIEFEDVKYDYLITQLPAEAEPTIILTYSDGTQDSYTDTVMESSLINTSKTLVKAELKDGVTSIEDWAFEYCGSLESVTIGNDVTSISRGAFSECDSLISITIPNSVTSIGDDAFFDCDSLTSITIPNSVTSIGDEAFYNCMSLTSVEIPNSVTYIGNEAFASCTSLTSVEIPNSVTSIGGGVFEDCTGLTSVTIPNSVKYINDNTFLKCTNLTSVEIPNSVIYIGNRVFENCTGLTSVTIPDSVTHIGNNAFGCCTSLTSITIPDSVTSIGLNPFAYCYHLTSITVDSNNTVYDSRNNCNAIIETATNALVVGCQNTVILDSITSIDDNAFDGCQLLTSVTIPNSVTTIGKAAFADCKSLTSVEIPNSVTSIGYNAFFNCTNLTSVTIPNSVTSIGNNAFFQCTGLTSVTIPDSVTSIGLKSFAFCYHLTSITVDSNNTVYDSRNNCNAIIETATNALVVGCQNTVILDSITSIDDNAFDGCQLLTSVTIPNSVTTIGKAAFADCSHLLSVIVQATTPPTLSSTSAIPSNVRTIYVPSSSVSAYKTATNWSSFSSKIQAIN